jgi:ADP-heptose:LPS heptosyltransferase
LLISKSYALVACSTGPYHIAGLCGIKAIGLFSARKPIHPGRWKALGKNAVALVYDENCTSCKSKNACVCIQSISVEKVMQQLL